MRYLVVAMAVLVAAVALSLQAARDSGHVAVAVGPWVVEASLVLVAGVIVLAFGIFYLLVRVMVGAWNAPGGLGRWRRSRQRRQAVVNLQRGLIALAEGRHGVAERWLTRGVRHSEVAAAHYLAAARAAHGLEAPGRVERYLGLASRAEPAAGDAATVTRAELALARGEAGRARTLLETLLPRHTENTHVAWLLAEVRAALEDWPGVLALLPGLRRRQGSPASAVDAMEVRARSGVLYLAAREAGTGALNACWQEVPERLRRDPQLLRTFTCLMLKRGGGEVLEPLLRAAITRRWDDELVRLYGLVQGADPARQLAFAESLLESREMNPALLLSAGRLAMRARLWGKARAYLESSIGAGARPETYQALTELLEEMGEGERAEHFARQGLRLAAENAQT